MAEKQELVRKKRDLKDQVQHLEDKQREILQKAAKEKAALMPQPAPAASTSANKRSKK